MTGLRFRLAAASAMALAMGSGAASAQEAAPPAAAASGYQTAPAPIADILSAPPTPFVQPAPEGALMAVFEREALPPLSDLAQPILRLAGYRINPETNGPANERVQWLTGVSFLDAETGTETAASLPEGLRLANPVWSPEGGRVALMAVGEDGVDLWVADADGSARQVASGVNAAFGQGYRWIDEDSLLVDTIPQGRGELPDRALVPEGPLIDETEGRTAPARTFQDLLSDPHDEALFEHFFTSQLAVVSADGGEAGPVGAPGIYLDANPSPDGSHILLTELKRPYSRVVPAQRFPQSVRVIDRSGAEVFELIDRPALDDLPPSRDAAPEGPRSASWRADADAVLVWAEAADGGDPSAEAEVRDRVMTLAAPFDGEPQTLAELSGRYWNAMWGGDELALVVSRWFNTRTETRYAADPSGGREAEEILTRNYQDRYNDPGMPVTDGSWRQARIRLSEDGAAFFLSGTGSTAEGDFPFIDRYEIETGETTRLWRAEAPYYEQPVAILDADGGRIVTRRESADEAPNFFLRDLEAGTSEALTDFADPAPDLAGVRRELVTYTREDGVALSGTLHLPEGHDPERDGPLPIVMWAYPTEFTDPDVAGQVVDQGNRFVRPMGSSHLFLLTQGYAVFDNPAMPIVGRDGAEPNDTYVEQLAASARAAVDAVVDRGVATASCVAVGGHSYGAFMTANLLAHTDLFAAGIARSGAYNRTLTPFGFQAEQRTFWQAGETYMEMSPFTYAHQITDPILLIHGDADNNSGTFPVQSERFYAALKGNGATARYVVLPHESHGYRAMESVNHALWEMTDWLDRHVGRDCGR